MQKDSWALVILILMPIAGSLVALMFPKRNIGAVAALLSFMTIGYVAVMVLQFKTFQGLQQNMDKEWIPQLGITFSLGVDGLNVFLIALTAVAWSVATFAASRREIEQPRMFYMMMALAQAGTIGAFAAQDLILFVLFFDLLLIPFYFLIGMWGEGDRAAATTKFVIYTLVGSLLMFAAAIGLGVSMAAHGNNELSFAFTDLAQGSIPDAAQKWIFAGFAIALLIKMPLPPLHGWMPDTYRSAPLAVLIPLSAVVAKLGAYGFLRVVLPLLPDASADFSDLMIVLSIIGIVYGSVMAFTQDNARLVIGYSSIAQIGFIG
ncbi:MAG TPA: NADH-quinone oxidoreductase subunit M, partial [Solirubrobacterales bacterium]|nr:NADH-quinone oxidoreductase subunit M [Solirubrobacterales bacterium]